MIEVKARDPAMPRRYGMATFLYRCPATGWPVQGRHVEPSSDALRFERTYVAERCPACGHLHFVNPLTGGFMAEEATIRPQGRVDAARASPLP